MMGCLFRICTSDSVQATNLRSFSSLLAQKNCAQTPYEETDCHLNHRGGANLQAGSYAAAEGHAVEAMLQSNSRDPAKIFDARAVAILEEAISVGALPQFSLANDQPLDLRHVPPCIAEVLPSAFHRVPLHSSVPGDWTSKGI